MPRKDGGLAEVRAYPLSDSDIKRVLGRDMRIITNRDLDHFNHVDQLFDRKGRCMMLYTPDDPNSGHWVCLWKDNEGIHYFDSYGEKPDIPEDLGGQDAVLTPLLESSGLPVFYSTHKYQKEQSDVATCGRWCIARLLYRDRTPDEFYDIIRKFKGQGDDFVSALIYSFIKK
jgi:hypothetical protein